jgi:hypothetical protein
MKGQLAENNSPTSALHGGLAIIMSIPVLGFCGVLSFVGLRSMTAPSEFGDLRICLWTGLSILAAWGLFLFHLFWITPQRTILCFELADGQFSCTTRRDGTRTYLLSSLKSVTILAGKRSIYGWLVRFRESKHLQINCDMPNAEKLAAELASYIRGGIRPREGTTAPLGKDEQQSRG